MARTPRSISQTKQDLSILLCSFMRGAKYLLALTLLSTAPLLFAIPPNHPVTNTAVVDYQAAGVAYSVNDSVTVLTDANAGNSPPHGLSLDTLTIAENLVAGNIGAVTVADLDPADSHTITTSDPRFVVNGGQLQLAPGVSLDFEATPTVPLTLTASDSSGASISVQVVVTVIDVNEVPLQIDLDNLTVDANTPGATVGQLTTTDVDAGDSHTYSVDDARFEVVGGELKLLDGQSLPLGETVALNITSTDSGGLSITQPFTATSQPPGGGGGVNASINLRQYSGAGTGVATQVSAPLCDAGSGPAPLAAPQTAFGVTVAVPDALNLLDTDQLKSGGALFVQVTDVDANLDISQIDQVGVTITTASGDVETLTLFETTPNSGNFSGYVQTRALSGSSGDCTLQTVAGEQVLVSYTDANDPTDSASAAVTMDPPSLVFDAASGRAVNGAEITLLNADGSAAAVRDDDGVSAFSNVTSSGLLVAGEYRFPFVSPGDYLLRVVAPNRFRFPTTRTDTDIQNLPGAPFALSDGSRGQVFTVPVGPTMRVDIPLDIVPVTPTPSELDLFTVVPGAGDASEPVGITQCFDGAQFNPYNNLVSASVGATALPATLDLATQSRFVRGDAVMIRLTDPDQDLDPFAPDTVDVQVSVNGGRDVERLRLTETADSSGVFSGFVQIGAESEVANNCSLEGPAHSSIEVSYQDAGDAQDVSTANAVFDPAFQVFASDTGRPVDGAEVTLIDAVSGLPATGAVFAADGTTSYPVTVISGGQVTDGSGAITDFGSGAFSFPRIAPGSYRLQVVAPASYVFPSSASDQQLAQLGPAFTIAPGSRGENFAALAGIPTAFDVPLDPVSVGVFVTKEASRETLAVGDFVQYRVTATSASSVDIISAARLIDTLPQGFRYASGSLRLGGEQADAALTIDASGERLSIELGNIDPGQEIVATYVAEVTVGTPDGVARNQVEITGIGVGESNRAYADVLVRNDLFVDTTFIIGRVTLSDCGQDNATTGQGIGGVRVLLEDGSFVVTDDEGKYHFQDVEPGTHVVQLDTATLPFGLVPSVCEQTTAFAGRAFSQFVDLKAGSLWRADFNASRDNTLQQAASIALQAEPLAGGLHYTLRVAKPAVAMQKLRSLVLLPDAVEYVAGSARLNGASIEDPRGIELGALNFRLPATDSAAEFELSFRATNKVPSQQSTLETKAVLMFETQAEDKPVAHKSEVATLHTSMMAAEPGPPSSAATQRVPLEVPLQSRVNLPYQLPAQDKGTAPRFDLEYLRAHQHQAGIVFPAEDYNPVLPAIPVAVVHPSDTRPHLLVDGELVSPLTRAGSVTDKTLGLSLTSWDGVPISESDSTVELQLEARVADGSGQIVGRDEVQVHFSGAPVRAEFLAERSYLIADGLHPPLLAVRLFDRAGYPLRAGTTGEFSVAFPYTALNQTRHLENLNNQFTDHKYRVLHDGIAYIQLEPTAQTGEVALSFRFDAVRQETIRARLLPGQRDWIMVGLLEGSLAGKDLDGQMQDLREAGLDVEREGRAAFYAKGSVRGDWLLTVAYDTDKKFAQSLYEQIDPNQYYTLYGDGTSQLHDAPSQQKLYLKVERSRFAGLFGDFDTEFQKSQLARYERRLHGVNAGYYGRQWEIKGFASDTAQGFVRDEIPGDGTSGVYRLTRRPLIRNSEQVKIVTRDRFSPAEVVSEQTLTRFQDYTIDYDRGTLIFRQPVLGQDEQFNPLFINIEYEVEADGQQELVGGVRAAYRLDEQESEVALTYLRDQNAADGGELMAADVTWQVTDAQKITLEVASSDHNVRGRGQAYLLEFEHNGEQVAGRAYLREQETAFGLGHQSAFERGVRQLGVEGEYRVNANVRVRGQAFEQTLLELDTDRQVADVQAEYQQAATQLRAGVRHIAEQNQSGSADATQLTAGASRDFFNKKLNLRLDGEYDVSSAQENIDYPHRVVVGAEYQIYPDVAIIGAHELTFSDLRDTQDSRLGMRARPWQGADLHTMLHREGGEQGERLFATTGVMQQWRVSESWLLDFGFDQVNTFAEGAAPDGSVVTFNPFNPTASGSNDNDYNAYYLGAGYQQDAWAVSSRLERHEGDQADKWNLLVGANRQLAEGRVVSGSLAVLSEELTTGGINDVADLRFGLAWRPAGSSIALLNRTDFVYEKRRNGLFDSTTRKWINNAALNFRPNLRHQLSVNLGLKFVRDQIDGQHYNSGTVLLGSEYRYHFLPRWDLGLHGSGLSSLQSNVQHFSYGASLGMRLLTNSWLSVGYNFDGFYDDDFVGADYAAKGWYVKFRLKFDQHSAREFLQHARIEPDRPVQHANGR